MIEVYFDDSGTHDSSPLAVWGGVVGTAEQFKFLEEEWRGLLMSPLPGKPPLSKFSLYDCRSLINEFSEYKRAESDHLQYLFRSLILKAELMPVAYGVDVCEWNKIVTGPIRAIMGEAERAPFGMCAKAALEIADSDGDNISIIFDQGRRRIGNDLMYGGACALYPVAAQRAAVVYSPVISRPGLQAADVVANYFYRYALSWMENRMAEPECHFQHLISNCEQRHYALFGPEEISHWTAKMRQIYAP